jgi:tetratricopeptide (TPR) repeat protein
MAREDYDFEHVTDLLSKCVAGDPSNVTYLDRFLTNLYKKYKNNKKGDSFGLFKLMGPHGAVKKALGKKDWNTVIARGLDVLKINPWDGSALAAMATACMELGFGDAELKYLKCALGSSPRDVALNRQCAVTYTKRGQFDSAIACWHVVEQARPNEDEAARAIGTLLAEKQRQASRSQSFDDSGPRPTTKSGGRPGQPQGEAEPSKEEKLRRRIAEKPQELAGYIELSEFYVSEEQFEKADKVLAKAFEISDGDADVRERWEDAQLRHLRQQLAAAEQRAKSGGSAADQEEFKRIRKELRTKELEVYKFRCDRYPTNLGFKYDLGLRYQLVGDYGEAITQYQAAQNDPRRKGLCLLALGQCFQHIKKYGLAMSHYNMAAEEIPDRDLANKKLILYQAGKLALAMKDVPTAAKYLTHLAGLDFSYKDVSALLDKLEQLGHDKGPTQPPTPPGAGEGEGPDEATHKDDEDKDDEE